VIVFLVACIETAQGILGAFAYGLDTVRRGIERQQRQKAKAARFAEQVSMDIKRLP
jgi:hypothetical protein